MHVVVNFDASKWRFLLDFGGRDFVDKSRSHVYIQLDRIVGKGISDCVCGDMRMFQPEPLVIALQQYKSTQRAARQDVRVDVHAVPV